MAHNHGIGDIVTGNISRLYHYGIFLTLESGQEAYIRRSKLSLEGLYPHELFKEGDEIAGEVINVKPNLELDRCATLPDPWDTIHSKISVNDTVRGIVIQVIKNTGIYLRLQPGIDGLIELSDLRQIYSFPEEQEEENKKEEEKVSLIEDLFWVEDRVECRVKQIRSESKLVILSLAAEVLGRQQAYKHAVSINEPAAIKISSETETQYTKSTNSEEEPDEELIQFIQEQSLKICIIEDRRPLMDTVIDYLRGHGFELDVLESPQAARLKLQEHQYDLIFLDYDVAGTNGLELVKPLTFNHFGLPAIVMTNTEQNLTDEVLHEHHILARVAKNIREENLKQIISEVAFAKANEQFPNISIRLYEQPSLYRELFSLFHSQDATKENVINLAMEHACKRMNADHCILFEALDSGKYDIVEDVGSLTIVRDALHNLENSIVKVVIVEEQPILDPFVFKERTGRGYKHSHLLRIVEYGGCIGYPIRIHGRVRHCLFFLYDKQKAVETSQYQEAISHALLIGALLTEETINLRLQAMGRALISADLAATTSHELKNILPNLCTDVKQAITHHEQGQYSDVYSGLIQIRNRVQAIETTISTVQAVNDVHTHKNTKEANVYGEVIIPVISSIFPTFEDHAINDNVMCYVVGDAQIIVTKDEADRLRQVFINLLLNAIDMFDIYREHMRPQFDTRFIEIIMREVPDGSQILIRDSGPGIHFKEWQDIFLPGYTKKEKGSGLGLTIARSFVNSMNCKLRVLESNILTGTTFEIFIDDNRRDD